MREASGFVTKQAQMGPVEGMNNQQAMSENQYMRNACAKAFQALCAASNSDEYQNAIDLCCRFFPMDTVDASGEITDDVQTSAENCYELLWSDESDDAIEDRIDEAWRNIVVSDRQAVVRGYARCAVLLEREIEPMLDKTYAGLDETVRGALAAMGEEDRRGELLSMSRDAQVLLFGL
jgi:hypothetical protein